MEFVSSKKLYAEVRATLGSYFSVGAMDDILFDLWTGRALEKLGATVKIKKAALVKINNFTGELPSDFDMIHGVWTCTTTSTKEVDDPTYTYYQEDYTFEDQCEDKCGACKSNREDLCTCPEEYPKCSVVHRVSGTSVLSFERRHRLVPGDMFTRDLCNKGCPSLKATGINDTFQISGCHIATSIKNTSLNVYYYAKAKDKDGSLLIPDHPYIHEYLFNLLVYNSYNKLFNDTHDETYSQVKDKLAFYKQAVKDAYLNMEMRLRMPSREKILNANEREKKRFNRLKRRYY